ncbi:MAG: IS1595 family transposase [Nitrosotalea sp.]
MPGIDPIKLAASVTKSRVYFCHIKWQGRRTCPRCNHRLVHRTDDKYRCKRCWYKFGDFTGTYMSKLRIAPNTVSHLLYLFSLGVPAYRTRFSVGINLSTVQHAFRVFRESIYDSSIADLRLSGKLEIDEASFGGHRKGKRGWGAEGKTLVFGIYKRNGQVMTFPVPDRKYDTLMSLVKKHTKKGSLYYTDDYTAYASLNMRGKHKVVAHGMDEYVRDDAHINGIEGFWSYAKTWMYHYRGVPRQYFHLYLKEIEFRFNNRENDLFPILSKLLIKCSSK